MAFNFVVNRFIGGIKISLFCIVERVNQWYLQMTRGFYNSVQHCVSMNEITRGKDVAFFVSVSVAFSFKQFIDTMKQLKNYFESGRKLSDENDMPQSICLAWTQKKNKAFLSHQQINTICLRCDVVRQHNYRSNWLFITDNTRNQSQFSTYYLSTNRDIATQSIRNFAIRVKNMLSIEKKTQMIMPFARIYSNHF